MNKIVFLQPHSTVVPTEARDYPEWHLGRERYALWYIEVDDPVLISYLTKLREQFSDLLYQPNQRQFHITLFVAGFWVEQATQSDDFSRVQLNQQLERLKNLKLESFQLQMGELNSFESALFLKVDDTAGVLDKIRKTLLQTSQEVAALSYCPHITLGLYREAVSSDHVLARMAEIEDINSSLNISKLTFGFYQAHVLQGLLFSHAQIELGNAQCS